MANRERQTYHSLFVTEEEDAIIKRNMEQTGIRNFSVYARKMLCDGYINHIDYSQLRELNAHLGEIARCLNQIAKRANETRFVGARTLEEVRQAYYEDWAGMKGQISKEIHSPSQAQRQKDGLHEDTPD